MGGTLGRRPFPGRKRLPARPSSRFPRPLRKTGHAMPRRSMPLSGRAGAYRRLPPAEKRPSPGLVLKPKGNREGSGMGAGRNRERAKRRPASAFSEGSRQGARQGSRQNGSPGGEFFRLFGAYPAPGEACSPAGCRVRRASRLENAPCSRRQNRQNCLPLFSNSGGKLPGRQGFLCAFHGKKAVNFSPATQNSRKYPL